jgi:hypothetical protein
MRETVRYCGERGMEREREREREREVVGGFHFLSRVEGVRVVSLLLCQR